MKLFFSLLQSRKFQVSLVLSLIIIWIAGPYLAIAGNTPLETIFARLIATLIAILTCAFMAYRHYTPLEEENLSQEVQQELATLKTNIQRVFQTLYKNSIKSFLFRYRKPWYLVLGPTNAGKSTLLTKSELTLRDLHNLTPSILTPTKFFHWWLSDDAVFIDIGGRYLRDNKSPSVNTEQLFQGFFKLLKRYRSFKPINGVIIAVNLQELAMNPKDLPQLVNLKSIINELVYHFMDFPVYLLVTRCDMIEGFTEFFEDLGPEERQQIFGITFPLSAESDSLPQLFHEQYNALLARLHEKTLWRLQQENNIDKVGKIKNFPLQLEFLKGPLAKLLNIILPNTRLNLRGIFFTSALQKEIPIDNLSASLTHAFDIQAKSAGHRAALGKSFFIKDVFQRVIFPESRYYATNTTLRSHVTIVSLIVLIGVTCLCIFYKSFRHNQDVLQQTVKYIATLPPPNTTLPFVNHLSILQAVSQQLEQPHPPWYRYLGLQQAHKLKQNALTLYTTLLTTKFLAYLKNTLETQLQNTPGNDASKLYANLKAYLMMGDARHFDAKFFRAWFSHYWYEKETAPEDQHRLETHLVRLLSFGLQPQKLNPTLIENTRALLNSVPPSRLVVTILENHYQGSPLKILPGSPGNLLNHLPRDIPGIYHIANFKRVYDQEIPAACVEIGHGDWVLGKKFQPALSNQLLNQLVTEVKAIYLNEYALIWSDILSRVKFNQFQTISQAIEMIDLLNNPTSPLIQVLMTIKNNTQPLASSIDFTQQVSSRFLALSALSVDMLRNNHQASLLPVKTYLNNLLSTADVDKACFDVAKVRMEGNHSMDPLTTLLQEARLLPQPLQTWYMLVSTESWRLILRNTQSYLNRIWMATVYPQYLALVDKRYPLFKEASQDASLAEFTSFFGNGGVMDIFFKNYLQPFIDNSHLYWEWKTADGQHLNIAQQSLEMFIRAALIQKMFFQEDARTPNVNFSLVPSELDTKIQSFTLNIEGQLVQYQKDNEQILSLSWPGPQPNRTEMIFRDHQGRKTTFTETSPWSWFKLLDKARLEPTTNPKHYKLSFNLNNATVRYELYTTFVVNPFLSGILNAFRCPESL